MPLNWLLESLKWQRLSSYQGKRISLIRAIKVILVGQYFSVITPARIGDYGGRWLMSGEKGRKFAFSATFWSSLAQNFIGISFGLICLYGYSGMITQYDAFRIQPFLFPALIVLLTCMMGIYFFGEKLIGRFVSVQSYTKTTLAGVLILSAVRFSVYLTQYYLLLRFCGVGLSGTVLLSGIGLIWFVQSTCPIPPFLGLLARAEIAVIIWTFFGVDPVTVIAASLLLWIINLFLPSFFGWLLLKELDFQTLAKNNPHGTLAHAFSRPFYALRFFPAKRNDEQRPDGRDPGGDAMPHRQ